MRLRISLSYSVFFALVPSLVFSATELLKSKSDVNGLDDESNKFSIFNGAQVPPLLELEGESFSTTVQDGYWFIKHYSPWCMHCTAMAPIWQKLYEFYQTSSPAESPNLTFDDSSHSKNFSSYYNFHFGSLDCDAYGSRCNLNNVSAYPTFILYKNGKEVDRIEGTREMADLSKIIEAQLESIRPGSRPKDGPVLPAIGRQTVKENGEIAAEHIFKDFTSDTTTGVSTQSISTANMKEAASSISIEETSGHKQPLPKKTKPLSHPNLLGVSTPLTTEKFQSEVTMSQDPWLIKFYVPWCSHCQAMAPNWIQLAKEMKGRLNIGEVNCDTDRRLCKDAQLGGYPTILFFRGGERVEYNGLRGLGDFVSYANKAIEIGEGIKDVDEDQFKALEKTDDVIFVYFHDHATTSEDFAALERLTLSLIGHAKLVKTNSKNLADRFKIATWPRLIVSRDGRPTYYTPLSPPEMRDFRRILHWMHSVWLPIVPELTASNSKEIMNGKLVVLAILTRERIDEFQMAKKELKSAALEWMDKQTIAFQRERQELRDAKQLRIEEAEDRNDQRALRSAKNIRINMEKSEQKEVGFAWVDGVFWERWIRQTYGIQVAKDGEKVIINDEDNHSYWDTTITGNAIIPSRTSILETIPKVASSPPKIKPKSTVSRIERFFFDIKSGVRQHPYMSAACLLGIFFGTFVMVKGKVRRNRSVYLRLDDKDRLLGSGLNGKVD
ncbi:Uncharacterized protein C3D6.13c [Golovinomyces cichoracearum]|uniref:Uncharacterized protein C3D6.13c n=1 Tax=Golovinomyces cichoracearum TaxID=62708 RepID=A0A420J4D5_9PEZI|nr:Uncharacterized protein C3D6.13c [Golovinomyces cichoracearum]